jgi:superfamily II DNA or RNA helicase
MQELELFKTVDRTERQKQCVKKWLSNKAKGCIVATTGFGKTRVALTGLRLILKKYPKFRVLVVVPTETLQNQWISLLDEWGLGLNCDVQIINTVIKNKYDCDILVIDEIHRTPSNTFQEVFNVVKYKYILGLTATFERLDGKEKLIEKYCPVIDTITSEEALFNGWVSSYTEYLVIIDVDDLDVYKNYNKEFQQHFEFFNYDFNTAMSMVGPKGYIKRIQMRDEITSDNASKEEKSNALKNITYHSMGFMRVIQARKKFINNHPKKIELCNKIMNARKNSKIITFSKNVAMAEAIEGGKNVYTGKVTKKKGRIMIEDFDKAKSGTLHSCDKLNEGADLHGASVAIILGLDSSKTKATQRRGRVIRAEAGKHAEIFNLVLNNTVELEWFKKSHKGDSYKIIDVHGLEQVLRYEEPDEYKKPVQRFSFRY